MEKNCCYWPVDKELFLQEFANEVANNKFERLPYGEWRKLSHASTKKILIQQINSENYCIYVYYEYENGVKGQELLRYNTNSKRHFTTFTLNYVEQFATKFHDYSEKPMTTLNANKEISITGTTDLKNEDWLSMLDTDEHTNLYKYYTNKYFDPYGYSVTTMPSYELNNTIATTKIDNNAVIAALDLNNEKENKTMKTDNLFNFEFGPASSSLFRLSPYGLAVHTSENGWVAYNAKTGEIFNVDILNFDASKLIYKMPVALKDIAVGDILMHSSKPVFVRAINSDGTVSVINYTDSSVKNILPVKSPFGFNFFTKVCALIDFNNAGANSDNPFGNMLPFFLLSGEKNDIDPAIFLLMNGGNNNLFGNPMMAYLLLNQNGSSKKDMLPLIFMMNQGVLPTIPKTNEVEKLN